MIEYMVSSLAVIVREYQLPDGSTEYAAFVRDIRKVPMVTAHTKHQVLYKLKIAYEKYLIENESWGAHE
jgi:hypothetical protein